MGYESLNPGKQFIVRSFFLDIPNDMLRGKEEGFARNVFCPADNITVALNLEPTSSL
jgi:hypothetical protein